MENEEKIRLEARRRLEEQLKQYRVQRHKERVSAPPLCRLTWLFCLYEWNFILETYMLYVDDLTLFL